MLVPRLEREHAEANALVSHVADYPEYPGETHPSEALRMLLGELGLRERFGRRSATAIRGSSATAGRR